MSFFLFIKQFVDMLYPYRILDYFMVILVLFLLLYQIILVRPDIRGHLNLTDWIIGLLGILLTVSWLRSEGGYGGYVKALSAFLLYGVGRIYYDRIQECYGGLVYASYGIIYLNFFYRCYCFGINLFQVRDASGDFYDNDTDMAFAMILALVFIAMFGKNTVRKLATMFLVCPYMVFFSDAGIQIALLLVIYAIIMIYVVEIGLGKRKMAGILLVLIIVSLLGVIMFLYAPVLGLEIPQEIVTIFSDSLFDVENMYTRYASWREVLALCDKSVAGRLFGTSMSAPLPIQSLYIKIFYSLGYVGMLLALALIISVLYRVAKVRDRKTFYLSVMMAALLLGSGVTTNSMESTQMSWFPLLFAGMVVSSVQMDGGEPIKAGRE